MSYLWLPCPAASLSLITSSRTPAAPQINPAKRTALSRDSRMLQGLLDYLLRFLINHLILSKTLFYKLLECKYIFCSLEFDVVKEYSSHVSWGFSCISDCTEPQYLTSQ